MWGVWGGRVRRALPVCMGLRLRLIDMKCFLSDTPSLPLQFPPVLSLVTRLLPLRTRPITRFPDLLTYISARCRLALMCGPCVFSRSKMGDVEEAAQIVYASDGIEMARRLAAEHAQAAADCIGQLPPAEVTTHASNRCSDGCPSKAP